MPYIEGFVAAVPTANEDERGGFALICTAKARSDRRLRTHQTAAMRRHRYVHGLPAPRGT